MNRLFRNLLLGIVFAIVSFFLIQVVAKKTALNAYNHYISSEDKTYEIVHADYSNASVTSFIHNLPYFSLALPADLELIKAIDSNGITGYVGFTDNFICQLQVIDMYTLVNMRSQNIERRLVDYNQYSKITMDEAHDAYVKSKVASSPYGDVTNVVHSVQKIGDKTFIYLKYEIPDDDESMISKSYNFMVNGYTIAVTGLFMKNDKTAEISVDNLLRSIKFGR